MVGFPLPGSAAAVVAVPAPGPGVGWWAGASSATLDDDGSFVIAYRVRTGHAGRGSTVVARSPDGEHLTTVAHLDQARFDAPSMERPAFCLLCVAEDDASEPVGLIESLVDKPLEGCGTGRLRVCRDGSGFLGQAGLSFRDHSALLPIPTH